MKRLMTAACLLAVAVSSSYGANVGNWRKISVADGGYGTGSRRLSYGTDANSRGILEGNLLEMAFGFRRLGSLGFGLKGYESCAGLRDQGHRPIAFASVCPLYLYYPLFSSTPTSVDPEMRPLRRRWGHLFLGGSPWGEKGDYVHAGIAMTLATVHLGMSGAGDGSPASELARTVDCYNVGVQSGFYQTSDRDGGHELTKGRSGAYAAVTVGWGMALE